MEYEIIFNIILNFSNLIDFFLYTVCRASVIVEQKRKRSMFFRLVKFYGLLNVAIVMCHYMKIFRVRLVRSVEGESWLVC